MKLNRSENRNKINDGVFYSGEGGDKISELEETVQSRRTSVIDSKRYWRSKWTYKKRRSYEVKN